MRNVFLYLGMVVMIFFFFFLVHNCEVRKKEDNFLFSLPEGGEQRDVLTQTNRTLMGCYLSRIALS